ncbi:MAG: hypothetical protein FWG72_10990, partial [Oscillospiraceae bacterium]|nr:hypothetical protein [Oscillospiraceae bacterium]
MTLKKNARLLAACLFMAAVLAGCQGEPGRIGAGGAVEDGILHVTQLSARELQAPEYGWQFPAASAAADGANHFAFRLSAMLAESAANDNFVVSPYSVWLPLAALVNATDAQSRPALMEALGAAGIAAEDMNAAASRMLYDLTKLRNKEYADESAYYNPLRIVNAVFVDNDVTLKREFAQTFADYYRGTSINVDFSSRDAVDAVNRWASESTDGLIEDLIQEFDPLTVAVMANAIYFSDRWGWEFDPALTKEGVFHSPAGDMAAYYMLREGDAQIYYEDDRVQAMPLYFKNGGVLYIILPKAGNALELLSSMTHEYFGEIQAGAIQATGKLLLPRFSVENEIKGLKETLEALGVPLFDRASAPLTGGLIEEAMPVWLSDAIQKAV